MNQGPQEPSTLRRLGYSLLPGRGFDYLLHLRPREWPIVAAHTAFGYLLAYAASGEFAHLGSAVAGTFVFVVLLNGGTLAINSAFDRDEGDIGYLDRPPPPPPRLFDFGMGLMTIGLGIALFWLPGPFTIVYAACMAMSVVYSVPPFRWKAIAGLDLLINAVGFGVLTPLAGWTLMQQSLPTWALLVLLGFGPLFTALYPLTQLYQFEEDRTRGDRTLALVLGMRRSLWFALAMVWIAFGLIITGLMLRGAPIWALAAVPPMLLWTAQLAAWIRNHATMSPAQHKAGMYRALQAWAATDVLVLVAALGPVL